MVLTFQAAVYSVQRVIKKLFNRLIFTNECSITMGGSGK